jgi:hypothetical protein
MKAVALFLLLFTLLFSGCRKLVDIDSNYIGEWRGGAGCGMGFTFTLIISEDGHADYERSHTGGGLYGGEHWAGTLKSNGKRFHISAFGCPWFFILENPTLTNENVSCLFHDSLAFANIWRMKFRYPKTIGFDGAEVTMYRHN